MGVETAFMRGLAKAITNPARSAKVLSYLAMAAHGSPYALSGLIRYVTSDDSESQEQHTHTKTSKQLLEDAGEKPGRQMRALKSIQENYSSNPNQPVGAEP
jgi:hypothetical protein